MDEIGTNNYVQLCGVPVGEAEYSHSARTQDFFIFPLEVLRLSGNADTLNVVIREDMLSCVRPYEKLSLTGELRTFNSRRGDWPRLVITVFARSIEPCADKDMNLVRLRGTVCRPPKARATPMGRDICDLMLAVNRHYGRSDYLPCICWGARAREAALWGVGTRILLEGRVQSRRYVKLTEEGTVERTAFEVSVTDASVEYPAPAVGQE